MRGRRGFSLVELVIGIVVAGLIGAALMRLMLSQSRFYSKQDAIREARGTSRGAFNLIVSELRMVDPNGGIVAVAPESVTVRVPYAFGLVCGATAATTTVSLLPADSAMAASAVLSGYTVRNDTTGLYTYRETGVSIAAGDATICTAASITTMAGGRVISLAPGATGAQIGSPVFLYQRIRYAFAPSVTVAGQTGLWRRVVATGASEEIIAPFQSNARFKFYVLNADSAQSAVPLTLANIRGLELVLNGASPTKPAGSSTRQTFDLSTAVFFKNRAD